MASLFRELLEKQAALKPDVKLYDHQQKAIDSTGNNVIYAHATGSGKTLTGIAKFEKLREQGDANKALVVVPSSLRDNFSVKGVEKFTDSSFNVVGSKEEVRKGLAHNINPDTVYNIISYDIFRKDPDRYIRESGADTILTDESHRTKNEDTMTTRAFASDGFNQNIKNFIGLTGSITSNTPADLVPLVRQASRGKADIGKNKNEFIDRYAVRDNSKTYHGLADARKPIVGLKNKLQLQNELGKYIHYLSHEDIKEVANMPDTDLEVIKVPLTKDQKRLYKDMLADDPKLRKMIVKKRFETLKDEEASMAYSKLVEMRKIMNDPSSVVGGEFKSSPKLDRMVDDMEAHLNANPDGQALLLSHMIGGGIGSIEKELNERGIPYDRFIGKGNEGVTEESRQQAINDYNNRLKRVLLISGAGGEGISLNDTTFEGVFDPHFNPERMQQMEARGIRSGGLAHRPKEERVVDVNRYISTMPKTFGIFNSSLSTPDEAIYAMAQKKERQNKIVHDMLSNVRKQQEAKLGKTASEKSDALAEELLEERVIPYATNYATGSLPGQLAGWGLGAKYIKTPDTGNKAVDLAAKAGAVGLAGSIGGSLGRGASRAVSLHNRFDEDLDRDPTFEEYLKSVPIAMVPFVGGAVATPEAITRRIKEGEKTANSLFGELLEKEAMNKVKALLSAGQLSKRDVRRVLKPRTIADDINSRISAKAKRFEENMPETMNAKKYKNMSKIDNLSNAPAVDFRKETKYQGHRNREMLNIAKKDFGGPVKINYVGDDVLDGETGVSWENGSINEAHIELPKKDARQFPYRYGNGMRTIRTLDPASAKQARTITARHEIQGELGGYNTKQRLFGRGGINKTRVEFTNMNAHDNMGIPLEDGRLASKLSPRTKHVTHVRDRQNELTFNFKGTPLNQERYMNAFNDDFTKNMNRPSWTRTPSDLQKGKMMRDASRHNTGDPNAKAVTDNIDLLNKLDQYITKKVK